MYELGIVKRNITRADRAACDQMAQYGSATVHEAQGRVGLMATTMRPIFAGAQVSGTAGGGLVRATVTGAGEVVGLDIDPTAIDPTDPEGLADLVLAAIRDATRAAAEMQEKAMSPLTQGLPGMPQMQGTPGMPQMPQMPQMPGMPPMPGLPGSAGQ